MIACVLTLVVCASAGADSITYSGTFNGHPQTAEVALEMRGTVSYVSITDLVAKFGGTTSLQPDRIQVDLSGVQAWLKLNETAVNSSLDSFELRQPVLREGEAVLVAATDVRAFLMKGFGVETTQRVNRAPGGRTSGLDVSISDITGIDQSMPSGDSAATPPPPRRRTEIGVAIIDPGHGGDDVGAESASGIKEKEVALSVAQRLRRALEQKIGVKVRLSRDEDLWMSGEQRTKLANRDAGDILVSLHTGASRSDSASGFQIFYSTPEPGLNAASIAQSVSEALTESTATPCYGVRQARLTLFRELNMPGILIEMGYLTNAAEAVQLSDEAYQQRIAEGIAAGLAPFAKKQAEANPS